MLTLGTLHAPTLYITVTVIMVAAASILTYVGLTQRTYRGFWWWVWAQWLNLASAVCLLYQQEWPVLLALSVLLALQWPITMLTGLRSFYVRSDMAAPPWVDRSLLVAAFFLWLGVRMLYPEDVAARVAAFTIGAMACYGYSAAMVLSMPEYRRSAHIKALAIFFGIAIPIQTPRLIESLQAWGAPLANPDFVAQQPALVLALTAGVLAAVYMGLMLTYERTEQDLRESQRQLRLMVDLDMLTQLPNRVHFLESARQSVRLSKPGSCSLMLFDIDHFKDINEQHGHAAGDSALKLVSSVVRAMLRGRDLVGRIGGDQFVSLLPETSMPDAMHVAERMARQIADKQDTRNRRPVQLSFGLILVNGDETLEQAIHRASEALAEAKRQGRNCVVSASTQEDGSFRLVAVRALGPMA